MAFGRGKGKKAADYYDDYYYDDEEEYYEEYDEDGEYYYEEDEDKGKEEKVQPKQVSNSNSNELALQLELSEKNQELERLKREKEELAVKFASVQALPKHFQQVEEDNTAIQNELERIRIENSNVATQLQTANESAARAEANSRQFQREINVKQTEIDQLTEQLLNAQATVLPSADSEREKELLKAQIQELRKELTISKDQLLAKSEQPFDDGGISKEDIAEVMLEAQSKARQIVDQANFDSRRIISDAERDLQNISQDARTLYQKIYSTKSDSEMIFEELLRKLTILSDIEKREN